MTVKELIETLEELDKLDVVWINDIHFYEEDDIEFIPESVLNLEVQHYTVDITNGAKRKYRMVYIEC